MTASMVRVTNRNLTPHTPPGATTLPAAAAAAAALAAQKAAVGRVQVEFQSTHSTLEAPPGFNP
jgi:hypothetical protein